MPVRLDKSLRKVEFERAAGILILLVSAWPVKLVYQSGSWWENGLYLQKEEIGEDM